jgi:hypothetical protein
MRPPGLCPRDARWGQLSNWGRPQLERRVRELGPRSSSSTLLIYQGDGSAESRQASSCQAIAETLRRAGLAGEPDVRPVSVAAWAGATAFAETGRIEAAARVMGSSQPRWSGPADRLRLEYIEGTVALSRRGAFRSEAESEIGDSLRPR